jgi:hypothetical protein
MKRHRSWILLWRYFFYSITCFSASNTLAVTYIGSNASGQVISIVYENNGFLELSMPKSQANAVALKEIWSATPVPNGFSMIAPANSILKKADSRVEYHRVNKSAALLSCKSGCGATVPQLISVKR